MGNSINSEYLPNGSVQTTTDTPGLPQLGAGANFQLPRVPQINADYLNYIAKTRNAEAGDANQRKREAYEMQLRAMQEDRGNAEQDRIHREQDRNTALAQQRNQPITPTWYESQGAAMTPVGGPGIVPGLMIDPRKLPPSMRPNTANVAREGLTPDEYASLEERKAYATAAAKGQYGNGGPADTTVQRESNQATSYSNQDPYKKIAQQQMAAMYGR